jgi:exopolysaccharide biosynthesis polyprenyl glycosylphosphotransferase
MFAYQRKVQYALQLLLDVAVLKLVWILTTQLRIFMNPVLHEQVVTGSAASWVPSLSFILPVWLLLSMRFHLYRTPDNNRLWALQVSAMENTAALAMAAAVVTFFSRQFGDLVSRMFVPLMLPVAYAALYLTRVSVVAIVPLLEKHWKKRFRLALIGDSGTARTFMEHLQGSHASLFRGLIVPEGHSTRPGNGCSLPVLGTTRQMGQVINQERLTQVIVLGASVPSNELEYCRQVFDRMDVSVSCALEVSPDPIELTVSTIYGLPFLETIPIHFTHRQEIVKRVFDAFVAGTSIVALSPLFILIALIIKLTSKGPFLHKSFRIGRGGRGFTFLKFRSMYHATDRRTVDSINEKSGHLFKIKNDPRVTPFGRFLRRYSLDELPQLFNIVRGEMSFVGPRPLPATDLEPDGMSKEYNAWSEVRSRVQPGLTGLWQVSGRSDLSFDDMVRLDLTYVQNWSLALDLRIMLSTPLLVLRGAGAY